MRGQWKERPDVDNGKHTLAPVEGAGWSTGVKSQLNWPNLKRQERPVNRSTSQAVPFTEILKEELLLLLPDLSSLRRLNHVSTTPMMCRFATTNCITVHCWPQCRAVDVGFSYSVRCRGFRPFVLTPSVCFPSAQSDHASFIRRHGWVAAQHQTRPEHAPAV